jgi:hypothetical protein
MRLKIMMRLNCLFILLLSTNALANTVKMPPVEDFAKNDEWQEVKISPKGDYLSAVTRIDGVRVIAMIDAKTLKIIHTLKFKGNVQLGEYEWASDDKIVAETQMLTSLPTNCSLIDFVVKIEPI